MVVSRVGLVGVMIPFEVCPSARTAVLKRLDTAVGDSMAAFAHRLLQVFEQYGPKEFEVHTEESHNPFSYMFYFCHLHRFLKAQHYCPLEYCDCTVL